MLKTSLIIGIIASMLIATGAILAIDSTNSNPTSSATTTEATSSHSQTTATRAITTTTTGTGQPIVEVTATAISSSIPATGGNNITISCQRPTATQAYGTITISNQGTGSAALKVLVIQYTGLSSFATASLEGRSCGALPPNDSTTLYVIGLPVAGRQGTYYDGWLVLTSGAETNVFSGQFT